MDDVPQAACRILVVEDDMAVGEVVTTVLQEEGYDVRWATTGQAARKTFEEPSWLPTVIVLDLMLPDMSGEEAYAAFAQSAHWRPLPVIVLSGVYGAARRAANVPRATFLAKPFAADHLLALVRHACQ